MQANSEYILDFVLPIGETGPTGPTGPAGISAIMYTDFANTSTAGILQTSSPKKLPNNTNIFLINNNRITLNESGCYELAISGRLRETLSSTNAVLAIQIEVNGTQSDFLEITLQNVGEIYFVQQKMLSITTPQNVSVIFRKTSSSDASLENVFFDIKKFPY